MNHRLCVTILVQGNAPATLNDLKRMNRWAHKEYRDNWQAWIYYSCPAPGREWLRAMADAKKRMRVTIKVSHPRLFDRVNLWGSVKPLEDTLTRKHLGFIHDDREEFCDLHVEQVKCSMKQTLIKIEEAEDERTGRPEARNKSRSARGR